MSPAATSNGAAANHEPVRLRRAEQLTGAAATAVEATASPAAAIASASGWIDHASGLSTIRPPTSTTAPASASAAAGRISARIGRAYWLAQTMRASHSTSPAASFLTG